jgi:hypothetical protein
VPAGEYPGTGTDPRTFSRAGDPQFVHVVESRRAGTGSPVRSSVAGGVVTFTVPQAPRDPRVEAYLKTVERQRTVTTTGTGARVVGRGSASRTWERVFQFDPRTGRFSTGFQTSTAWSAGATAFGRPFVDTRTFVSYRALERKTLAIPGRPEVRILNRIDLRGLPLYDEPGDDFRDASRSRLSSNVKRSPDEIRQILKDEAWFRERLQYGYGTDPRADEEKIRDQMSGADWRRRAAASLPSALAHGLLLPQDPGYQASPAFRSFGRDLGDRAAYRTVQDAIAAGGVKSVNPSAAGGVEFEGGDGTHYQVLPDGRVRKSFSTLAGPPGRKGLVPTANNPFAESGRLFTRISTMTRPEEAAALGKEIFGLYHPEGEAALGLMYDKAAGAEVSLRKFRTDAFAPEAQALLKTFKKRVAMMGAAGLDLEALGVETHVQSANLAAQLIRASETPQWEAELANSSTRKGSSRGRWCT